MKASVDTTNNHLGGPWRDHPCCDTQAIVQLHRAAKAAPGSSSAANADHVPDPGNLVVPRNWKLMDYAGCLIAAPLLPIGAIMYPLLWISFSPVFFLAKLYLAVLRRPVKILERTFLFDIFTTLLFIISLPGILFTLIYWFYFAIVVTVGSIIVSLLTCRIGNFSKNWEVLKPHRKWPGWTWQDMVCGMTGAMDRQGYFEFLYRFPTVLLITPMLKYVFTTNPFIHDLSEEYCNQWSEPLGLDDRAALASVIMSLSWTAHKEADRKLIDKDRFAAHYPLAPCHRTVPSVLGVQFTNILVNITKSTHNIDGNNRSKSGKRGIFIVELYYWNPCHMLTGYVEVNIQHIGGIEHPMWCVIGKHHWAVQFFKNVDNLFWNYAPSAASFFKGHATIAIHPE